MSGLVLDAGALIAIDRGDRDIVKKVRAAQLHGDRARSNAMVVAQAWRDGKGRQVTLARALENMDVRSIHEADGRKAGQLLGRAGLSDAIDATVALLAAAGDELHTSDPDDLGALCEAAANRAVVIGY